MPRTERIANRTETIANGTSGTSGSNGSKPARQVTFANVENKRKTGPKKVFLGPEKPARSKSRRKKMMGSRKNKPYTRRKRLADDTSGRFFITQKQIDTMRKHRETGSSITTIANVMGISESTIHEHTKDIIQKMTVVNRESNVEPITGNPVVPLNQNPPANGGEQPAQQTQAVAKVTTAPEGGAKIIVVEKVGGQPAGANNGDTTPQQLPQELNVKTTPMNVNLNAKVFGQLSGAAFYKGYDDVAPYLEKEVQPALKV